MLSRLENYFLGAGFLRSLQQKGAWVPRFDTEKMITGELAAMLNDSRERAMSNKEKEGLAGTVMKQVENCNEPGRARALSTNA
jgi:hypothetical protein